MGNGLKNALCESSQRQEDQRVCRSSGGPASDWSFL